MNWLIKAVLFLARLFFMGGSNTLPTLQDAVHALRQGGLLEVTNFDTVGDLGGKDKNKLEIAHQYRNKSLSILYYRSSDGRQVRESYDLLIDGKSGGIEVFFIDDRVTSWRRRRVPQPAMDTSQNYCALEILYAARACCAES